MRTKTYLRKWHISARLYLCKAFFSGAFITLCVASPLWSEEPSDDFDDFSTLDLEALLNVEVDTGSGFKQKLSDVPAVVEVMNRERIEALGIRDLYELMLHLTGIRVDAANLYPLLINTPEVRGGSVSDRILLMIDDHPQLGELDEVYNGFAVPIESIERVEFLRGPAAVLYGSSSMAGVLRVITRKPDRSGGGGTIIYDPIGNGGELSGYGSYKMGDDPEDVLFRIDVQARRNEDWGNQVQKDGFGLSGRVDNQVEYISHLSTFRNDTWYARVQNHIIKATLMGAQPSVIFDPDPSDMQLHGVELGHQWTAGKWKLKSRLAAETRSRRLNIGLFPPPGINVFAGRTTEQNRTQMQFDGYSTELAFSAAYQHQGLTLLTGLQYRLYGLYNVKFVFTSDNARNTLFPVDDLKAVVHDANLYLQGGYEPIEQLAFLIGARANVFKNKPKNANFLPPTERDPDPEFSPMGRAAIVWRALDELTVKALYGRSFRLPTLLETYTSIFGVFRPNTRLKPETMDTVELSFDSHPSDSVFARLNGFYNRDRDTIESTPNPDPAIPEGSFDNNKDGFYNYGIEGQFDWRVARWLDLFGSLVFGEGYNYGRDAAGDRVETYERDVPRIIGNGGAVFKPISSNSLTLTPSVYHRGRSDDADSDTIVNFTARYQPLDWMTVSVHMSNIFDRQYYQPYFVNADSPAIVSFAQDTRTLRLGLHADF